MSIDDSDIFKVYHDLWKTDKERQNSQYQGIDTMTDCNATKLWLGAGNGAGAMVEDCSISST